MQITEVKFPNFTTSRWREKKNKIEPDIPYPTKVYGGFLLDQQTIGGAASLYRCEVACALRRMKTLTTATIRCRPLPWKRHQGASPLSCGVWGPSNSKGNYA
jgi:hypothetical protein